MLLSWLLACSDYDLTGKDENSGTLNDSGTGETPTGTATDVDPECAPARAPAEAVALSDVCDYEIGGFEPVVAWDVPGTRSNALPAVADLNGDGAPEIVAMFSYGLFPPVADLRIYAGDGSGVLYTDSDASLGFGGAPAVGDLDGDGEPEIVVVKHYFAGATYTYSVVAYAAQSAGSWNWGIKWESEIYSDGEFDYSTGPIISDMDHDGSPEIVAGREILNFDGSHRGTGYYGRGCPADAGLLKEGSYPAVADLDLDGVEEVITGNAMYTPDGATKWRSSTGDGAVGVANLDGDPEGEFVVVYWNFIVAFDTDGTVMWEKESRTANIFPIPAIGDIDGDGEVEIVVAGGNLLWALNADGSLLWDYVVHDESGATGASIFDFDADGIPEVVYIDEVQMLAFNGLDGVVKFQSGEHSSVTMYDYPVIADVDNNGHADIVVMHDSASAGMSIFRDVNDSWAPARPLWNQHAYSITNINDDLSVPVTAVPNFTLYNNYHSALALPPGVGLGDQLQSEILEVCDDDCDEGTLWVLVRGLNTGNRDLPVGIWLSLYADTGGNLELVGTVQTTAELLSGMTTQGLTIAADADAVSGADNLVLVVDDDGTGTGLYSECLETDNEFYFEGPFCE